MIIIIVIYSWCKFIFNNNHNIASARSAARQSTEQGIKYTAALASVITVARKVDIFQEYRMEILGRSIGRRTDTELQEIGRNIVEAETIADRGKNGGNRLQHLLKFICRSDCSNNGGILSFHFLIFQISRVWKKVYRLDGFVFIRVLLVNVLSLQYSLTTLML